MKKPERGEKNNLKKPLFLKGLTNPQWWKK
jgi:hypothetical protein